MVKNLLQCRRPRFHPWVGKEKGMATHSSVLAWRIPGTEEPGGLQSLGSQGRLTHTHTLVESLSLIFWETGSLREGEHLHSTVLSVHTTVQAWSVLSSWLQAGVLWIVHVWGLGGPVPSEAFCPGRAAPPARAGSLLPGVSCSSSPRPGCDAIQGASLHLVSTVAWAPVPKPTHPSSVTALFVDLLVILRNGKLESLAPPGPGGRLKLKSA